MPDRTICPHCSVTSGAWTETRLNEPVVLRRDYSPTTCVIRLKADTTTTYVVTPEVERLAFHIRSLNAGKLNYAIEIPLDLYGTALPLLDARIEDWHTEQTAPVCASHVDFATNGNSAISRR